MTSRLHVNLTALGLLLDRLGTAADELATGAERAAALVGGVGLEATGPRQVAQAGEAAQDVVRSVRSFLDQVRSLDQPSGYVLYRVRDHPSWADPGAALAAAHEVAEEMGRAFEWGLGDERVAHLVGLLASHEGDPVFSLELVRLAAGSSTGFGRALWAMATAPLGQRAAVGELARRLGTVLAVANRAAPPHVTFRGVMAGLERATGGDHAQLAFAPLLFAASARPFTRSFLQPMARHFVLRPNHERLEEGRALPATWVHDGEAQRDARSLALAALARNPRAAADFLAGSDLHGVPNLHLLIGDGLLDPSGPGILDGAGGRSLAALIDAATVVPVGRVGPWAQVTADERAGAAGAVVAAFGDRAPLLGWELPETLRPSLSRLTVANLPTFQMPPPSFAADGPFAAVVPAGVAPVVPRERGLRFLSLLFTHRAAEDQVVAAAERHIATRSGRLGAHDHDGHLRLGLLWGSLTDAAVAGRLVHAIDQDHARDEQRAAWALAQRVVSYVVVSGAGRAVRAGAGGGAGGGGGGVPGEGAAGQAGGDVVTEVGSTLRDQLLPDLQRTEQVHAEVEVVFAQMRERLDRAVVASPGTPGWAAALGGFEGGLGPAAHPPGYVEPSPALVVQLDEVVERLEAAHPGVVAGSGGRRGRPSAGSAWPDTGG